MPKSNSSCNYDKYLQRKIKKNMKEWKEGRWVSQKQALAVSYSEARKYKSRCKSRVKKLKSRCKSRVKKLKSRCKSRVKKLKSRCKSRVKKLKSNKRM
jgi:gas vesicle protein